MPSKAGAHVRSRAGPYRQRTSPRPPRHARERERRPYWGQRAQRGAVNIQQGARTRLCRLSPCRVRGIPQSSQSRSGAPQARGHIPTARAPRALSQGHSAPGPAAYTEEEGRPINIQRGSPDSSTRRLTPHASKPQAPPSPNQGMGWGEGKRSRSHCRAAPTALRDAPPPKKRTAPRALRERRVFLATRGSSHSRLQWQPRARKRKKCTENESIRKGTYTARRSSHQETITASTPRIVHTRCGPILAQESTRKHKKANTDTNTNLNRNQDFPAAVAAAPARSLPVVPRPVRRHAPLDDCARRAEARGLVAGVAQQQRDDAVRGHGRGREVAHRGAVVGVRPEVLGGRASCQASGVERWVERRMSARGERRYTTRAAGRTRTLYCLPARTHGDSVRLNVMSAGSSSTFSCGRGAARQ